MIWLLVSVLCDSKCVGPKWVETQEQFTLADLLEQVTGGKYLEASVIVKTGKEEQSPMHDAVLHQPLSTFYSYGDRFVKFNIICGRRCRVPHDGMVGQAGGPLALTPAVGPRIFFIQHHRAGCRHS